MAVMTLAERVAALEVKLESMVETQERHLTEQHNINTKLDDLLALRNKGVGAFWLATSLAGVGAISIFMQFLHWVGLK